MSSQAPRRPIDRQRYPAEHERLGALIHTLEQTLKVARSRGARSIVLAAEWGGRGQGGHAEREIRQATTIVWCDRHERRVEVCHRWCDRHDQPVDRCDRADGCKPASCTGVPLAEFVDPTGEAAGELEDGTAARLAELEANLKRAAAAYGAEVLAITRWAMGDRRPTERGLGGDCICCGRYVPNTDRDRLRSGLCNSCSVDWSRHRDDYPDRQAWRRARQAKLREAAARRHVDPRQHESTAVD